jgi:tRNA pseudouridine55 synthase
MSRSKPPLDGVLLVDKPAGITSAGVVREVKRRLGVVKVGHLGTLDPFATGLLPVAIGEGTKVVAFLSQGDKSYTGVIALGRSTDTLDSTGQVVQTAAVPPLADDVLEAVARQFRGAIEQVPPMFSALKRGGVPLYELARKGVDVERAPRRVHIESLSLALVSAAEISLSMRCSKGTYVRSLARDVAAALGTVGHLASLRRTAFGSFEVASAIPLDGIDAAAELPILPPRNALGGLRELEVDAGLAARIRCGQQAAVASLPAAPKRMEVAKVLDDRSDLVALVGESGGRWRIERVFVDATVLKSHN